MVAAAAAAAGLGARTYTQDPWCTEEEALGADTQSRLSRRWQQQRLLQQRPQRRPRSRLLQRLL